MFWPDGHELQNGKLVIEQVLGQGGFGITYKAIHQGFNAPVVIKTPNAYLRNDPDYAKYVKRFIREARTLAQLEQNPHPNIVRVKDLFEEEEAHCLVMEFIPGTTLFDEVQRRGPLPEAEALAYIRPIAEALTRVHGVGLVHRDATPVNIMLRENRQPVLIDFGISGEIIPKSLSSKLFGNRAFAPYEQLIKGDRSATVDIYTLGASLYYLITGQLPQDCFSRKVDEEPLIPPQELVKVSGEINQAILKGMALRPQDRYSSMAEFLAALSPVAPPKPQPSAKPAINLDDLLASLSPTPTPAPPPRSDGKIYQYEIITVNEQGGIAQRQKGQNQGYLENTKGLNLEMVRIPGGEFMMGAPNNEKGRSNAEGPQHRVMVPEFAMGRTAITQAQWQIVAQLPQVVRSLTPDPADFKGKNNPVETVSWEDCIEFCLRLSQASGKLYRLPSEAEWEYACRAGTTTPFHFGPTLSPQVANYDGNYTYGKGKKGEYRQKTIPVGSLNAPNVWGLHDMHGNVWEWCLDDWHDSYQGAPTDGKAWMDNDNHSQDNKEWLKGLLNNKSTSNKLLRGGCWVNLPKRCRSASRYGNARDYENDGIGFRVVAPRTL
ncbi:bifunctional serine/threonine-protein kinase/formylglycine-generating enzyme family protein [Spirulina major CS-329]|uniref:bifunctional serine/threonine-protein kinase/formylglycine-generating enzyme family protein n=1 Tax=Spirulina TaxID=1154 RepID=UPI00232B8F93|nr:MULTISPECIES: bifunctional serine/threonine-protein kinase/formylglycine-generating enzyme family protein [Spirulina]MDB9494389.1 bifunctional serine/threonine-protein kinase/formylglycine-generating enzyme family protein [Spirulina subsalsa CS-330]MDB9503958.1 bifunctional serine/threonine-protein kinase/formylglycine-generating enzyme family protein [Spirulina major CS-329]